jgi:hypothetical protein
VCDTKLIAFWPDEWEKVLGGVRAVGNYVQIFIPSKSQNAGAGVWRKGRVVEYLNNEDKYRVLLDVESRHGGNKNAGNSVSDSHHNMSNDETASGASSTTAFNINGSNTNTKTNSSTKAIVWESDDMIRTNFNECTHSWSGNGQRQGSLLGKKTPNPNNHLVLDYSTKDVGGYCRVYWPNKKRFSYGRIIAFNVINREHKIAYEDLDVKSYDMSKREYELIQLPPSFSFNGVKGDSECAKIVETWHLNTLARSLDLDKIPESAPIVPGEVDESNADMAAARPPAALAQSTSMHYYAIINAFFNEVSICFV